MWISRFIRRARERAGSERGFYMVWMALTLVTLTAFAGLGLEYGRWNNLAIRIQKAADAAALAGAVFMPETSATRRSPLQRPSLRTTASPTAPPA
jgi:Flp pilus assembly protein TadG